jgi:SAM-dependent methyltransferase
LTSAGEKDRKPNAGYVAFHRPRFAFLLQILRENLGGQNRRILDIGRSHLTGMIGRGLNIHVDSLGLEPDEELSTGRHYCFDLNDTQYPDRWRGGLPQYDVVVFAEVIEHLYTAPELVLKFLWQLLVPGGLLLLQTPNAVSLGKRVKLALGANPFERIRADRLNPGHFREYTLQELIDILRCSQFSVERTYQRYYFDTRFAEHETGSERPKPISGSIRNVAYRLLPPSLREGITIVARKEGGDR